MPTTYTLTAGSGANAAGAPAMTVLTGTYDASKQNAAVGDTVELIDIPAGTLVYSVVSEVETVDGTGTFDVGDGNDPDGWVVNDAAQTLGPTLGAGAYVAAGGKLYAAADTIDIAGQDITLDTLKVTVYVTCAIMGTQ